MTQSHATQCATFQISMSKDDEVSEGRGAEATQPIADLRKPTEMLVMIPRSQKITLIGRKLYNAMLQNAQHRLSTRREMPAADYMFEAPLKDVLVAAGTSAESRTVAKKYLQEMRGLVVDWESTAEGDGVKWRGFAMLSEVVLEVRQGQNWVLWSYPPTVMKALHEPGRWARLNLEVIAQLGSYAAVALYEICARYRDNPSGVTSRKELQWWIDALSQAPAGSEKEWRRFKYKRVQPAIEEINAQTDIEIELIEHKQGRAIAAAQFQVRKKHRQISLPIERDAQVEPADTVLVERAEAVGVREAKVEELIIKFGDSLVAEQLNEFEKRIERKELGPINSPAAYLRQMCVAAAEAAAAEPERIEGAAPQAQPGQLELPAVTIAAAEADRMNERYAQLRAEIEQLSDPERAALVAQAVAELQGRGLYSAVIRRRVEAGDFFFGPLRVTICRIYGQQRYGEDWAANVT